MVAGSRMWTVLAYQEYSISYPEEWKSQKEDKRQKAITEQESFDNRTNSTLRCLLDVVSVSKRPSVLEYSLCWNLKQ